MFAPEHQIIADNCNINIPCDLFIDAIEDSIMTLADKEVTKNNPPFNRLAVLQK
jgi:hypothetical protein